MRLLNKYTKSGWAPMIAIGLLVVGLWGSLLLKRMGSESEPQENIAKKEQTSSLALPNILAPVIWKEVNKEPDSGQGRELVTIKLPNLLQALSISQ